jgi:hypothetical protein
MDIVVFPLKKNVKSCHYQLQNTPQSSTHNATPIYGIIQIRREKVFKILEYINIIKYKSTAGTLHLDVYLVCVVKDKHKFLH